MCLYVHEADFITPIHELGAVKELGWSTREHAWVTPYRNVIVKPGTGWFMPIKASALRSTPKLGSTIYGGFIHSYAAIPLRAYYHYSSVPRRAKIREVLPTAPRSDRTYWFKAYARDVVAQGREDMVSKAIYIPAFDITGEHRNAIIDYTR